MLKEPLLSELPRRITEMIFRSKPGPTPKGPQEKSPQDPKFHDFVPDTHLVSAEALNNYLNSHNYKLKDYLDFYHESLFNHYFPTFQLEMPNLPHELSRLFMIKVSPNDQCLAVVGLETFGIISINPTWTTQRLAMPPRNNATRKIEIFAVCFDEENEVFFTAGNDKNVSSWDVRNALGEFPEIKKLKTYSGHENIVNCLAFSQGKLASGSFDRTVRLWLSDSEGRVIGKHKEKVISLSFSSNSTYLASGSVDFTIKIFNTIENIEEKVLLGHNNEITCLMFSPLEPEKLVSGALDMTVRLWDVGLKRNKILYEDSYCESIDNARFSNDGLWIVAIVDNKKLILWSTEREIIEKILDFKGFLSAIAFSKDSRTIFYSDTSRVYCMKLDCLREKKESFLPGTGQIKGFKLLQNSKIVAWDTTNVYLIEKDHKKGLKVCQRFIENSQSRVEVTLTENEHFLAYSNGFIIEIMQSGNILNEFEAVKTVRVRCYVRRLRFSRTGMFLVAVFKDSDVVIFSKEEILNLSKLVNIKGKKLELKDRENQPLDLVFSDSESLLAVLQFPSQVSLYDPAKSQLLKTFSSSSNFRLCTCIFCMNDEKLLTGCKTGSIFLWDIETGLLEKKFIGHTDKINGLTALRSGLSFASCSKDKSIRVWSIPTGQEIKIFGPFPYKLRGLTYYRNERKLMTYIDKFLVSFRLRNYLAFSQIKIIGDVLKGNLDVSVPELIEKYPKLFSLDSTRDLVLFREIHPYNLSIFHDLAFYQQEKSLEILLNICVYHKITPKFSLDLPIPFLKKPAQTPISLALELNNIAIVHLFIKSLKRSSLGPGCCPSITTQIISKLIEYEPSYVSELLESRFCEPLGELPRTYPEFDEPLQAALNLVVVSEQDITESLLNKRTEAIKKTFKKSLLKNEPIHKKCCRCLKRSSKTEKELTQSELIKSLEIRMLDLPGICDPDFDQNFFVKAHELESDHPLFGSRVFLAILQYKWDTYARDYFLQEALIYTLYLMILWASSLYIFPKRIAEDDPDLFSFSNLSAIFLDGVLGLFFLGFLLKEFFSIHKLRWRYFLDLDNYMDIPALIFLAILLFNDLGQIFGLLKDSMTNLRIYHSITLFLASLRFLSFARGFEAMAFMIRLIFRATTDMSYFLLIMFFLISSLAFSGFLLSTDADFTIFKAFNSFYRMILGDFEGLDDLSVNSVAFSLVWAAFLLTTLIIMIVMLNLLISIISDTYGKVSALNKLANTYEKTGIIIEIDKKLSNREKERLRKAGYFRKFLFTAYCKELKENIADFQDGEQEKGEFTETSKDLSEVIKWLETLEREVHKVATLKENFDLFAEKSIKNQEILNKRVNKLFEVLSATHNSG